MTSSALAELTALLVREIELLAGLAEALQHGSIEEQDDGFGSVASLEIHRAITAREVAMGLGLDGDATLAQLADAVGEEWSDVLRARRSALRDWSDAVRRRSRSVVAEAVDGAGTVVTLPAGGRHLLRSLRQFLD